MCMLADSLVLLLKFKHNEIFVKHLSPKGYLRKPEKSIIIIDKVEYLFEREQASTDLIITKRQ